MSNPNNGKVIEGTEDFTGGEMLVPSGASNGKDQSILYNEILKRIAIHDHSGKNSAKATLPQSASEIFPTLLYTITTDEDQADLFQITLRLSTITPSLSNLSFYFKDNTDADVPSSWIRFSPSFTVSDTVVDKEIVIKGLLRNDIDIKVSA